MKMQSSCSARLDVPGLCLIAALAAACSFDTSQLRALPDGAVANQAVPDAPIATGGSDGSAGTGGSGGVGVDAASSGGGSSGSDDAGTDTPVPRPETGFPSDPRPSEPNASVPTATPPVGPEAARPEPGPEPGPDGAPDLPRDLLVDLTPDTTPPRPEAGLDAGNCIQRFQENGYSLGRDASIAACSGCFAGSTSKEPQCKAMIGCLQPSWPSCARGSGCWLNCQNTTGSDSAVENCVAILTSAACASH